MTVAVARSPLRSLLAHPVIAVVITLAGLAAGLVAAALLPATHTAEARLAVVSATNNAYTIPGYPLAARELAADYARWVHNRATDGQWLPQGATNVQASPIPDSAVIRVEVEAGTPDEAVAGAAQVADTLVTTVREAHAQHDPEGAYAAWRRQAPAVAAARTAVQQAETVYGRAVAGNTTTAQVRAATTALQNARVRFAELELRQSAAEALYRRLYADTQGVSTLRQIAPAVTVGDPARSAFMRYGLVGAVAGGLLALVCAVLLDRRRARPAAHGASPSSPHVPPTPESTDTVEMVDASTTGRDPASGPVRARESTPPPQTGEHPASTIGRRLGAKSR